MWSEDPKRKPVSVSSDVERTMSHARWPEYGANDARGDRAHPTGGDEARPLLAGGQSRTSTGLAASQGVPGGPGSARLRVISHTVVKDAAKRNVKVDYDIDS